MSGVYPLSPFGPTYPDLGNTVASMRRKYMAGKVTRKEYGRAVSAAIRAKQRSELLRVLASLPNDKYTAAAHRQKLKTRFLAACLKDIQNGTKGLHEWKHTKRCRCGLCKDADA